MYLIIPKNSESYLSDTCPNSSHDLGRVIDGYQKVFKIDSDKVWLMSVGTKGNRWVENWIEVSHPKI